MNKCISLPGAPSVGRMGRRGFLKSAGGVAIAAFGTPVLAYFPAERSLSFVHTQTGQELTVKYFQGGNYHQTSLARIAFLMRDFHSGDVHSIDPMLLDALFELQMLTDHDKPYQVISAYRSPVTNTQLRHKQDNVAEHSMHIKGKAIDFRVSGVPTKKLRDLALTMNRGGVGYYPSGNSLHLDTGRLRSW